MISYFYDFVLGTLELSASGLSAVAPVPETPARWGRVQQLHARTLYLHCLVAVWLPPTLQPGDQLTDPRT